MFLELSPEFLLLLLFMYRGPDSNPCNILIYKVCGSGLRMSKPTLPLYHQGCSSHFRKFGSTLILRTSCRNKLGSGLWLSYIHYTLLYREFFSTMVSHERSCAKCNFMSQEEELCNFISQNLVTLKQSIYPSPDLKNTVVFAIMPPTYECFYLTIGHQ